VLAPDAEIRIDVRRLESTSEVLDPAGASGPIGLSPAGAVGGSGRSREVAGLWEAGTRRPAGAHEPYFLMFA
jgi:hypothetical protein